MVISSARGLDNKSKNNLTGLICFILCLLSKVIENALVFSKPSQFKTLSNQSERALAISVTEKIVNNILT